MPIVATVHHCLFLPVRVELPERCPHCQADFTEGTNLHEWNSSEVAFAGDLRAGGTPAFQVDDQAASGQTFHPVSYACGRCCTEIEAGASLLIQDEVLRIALCQLAEIPIQ